MADFLSIPKVKRRKEEGWQTLLANIGSFFLVTAAATLLGGSVLLLGKFTRGLVATVPNLPNPTSQLIFFYVAFVSIVITGLHFNEFGRKAINVVDHWTIRILSIVVVGGSDLARGRTWVAIVLYAGVGVATLSAAVSYTFFIVEGTDIGSKTLDIFLGRVPGYSSLPQAILGSVMLTFGVFLSLLPTAMVLSKSWWTMVKRPKFNTIDSDQVVAPGSHTKQIVVAHASDLHAFAPEQKAPDDKRLDVAIQCLAKAKADAILMTGDITEDGTHEAWTTLLNIPELTEIKDRIILAPGNHDLNAVHLGVLESIIKVEHPRRTGTHIRALHFLHAANLIMGERTRLVCPYTSAQSTLADVLGRAQDDIECWEAQKPMRRKALAPARLLEKLFPMLVEVPGVDCQFMVWNSVKLNRWPLLNAIGEIDQIQLQRGTTLLGWAGANAPVAHLIHHQVGVPRTLPRALSSAIQRWQRGTAIGMGLQNPADLLDWLAKRTQRSVILHGHHHKFFIIKDKDRKAHIVSAPSITLGVEMSYSKCVQPGPEGRWLELILGIDGPHVDLVNVEVKGINETSITQTT